MNISSMKSWKKYLGRIFLLLGSLCVCLPSLSSAATESIPKLLFLVCAASYETVQDAIEQVNTSQTTSAYNAYTVAKQNYEVCHASALDEANKLLDAWAQAISDDKLADAYNSYRSVYDGIVYDARGLEHTLPSLLIAQAQQSYQRGEYTPAESFLAQAQDYDLDNETKFSYLYMRAVLYAARQDFDESSDYGTQAKKLASTAEQQTLIQNFLTYIANRAQAATNDPLSFRQPWLQGLWIDQAWKLLKSTKQVIVAVIDNGMDLSHPDLLGQMRTNSNEIPSNKIDDDNNGYIDDVDGYNFYDKHALLPPNGSHGTQVSGLIWALPNNKIGIAGIVPHVAIMPLAVCAGNTCLSSQLLAAPVRYAVDNGAQVINMSLVSKHTTFSPELTDAITYAHSKGVTVVIAAGNWMWTGEEKVGVNTTTHALTPLCNELRAQHIIGVWAASATWKLLPWSNYGRCMDVATYGENVLTTTTTEELSGVYAFTEWTSFAAPIIAGITALGYAQYTDPHPDAIYEAMLASSTDGIHPQADTFLTILGALQTDALTENKVSLVAQKITTILLRQSAIERTKTRKALFVALDTYAKQFRTKQQRDKLRILIVLREELRE